MAVVGPLRHLVRRSGLVAFGGKADVQTRTRNDLIDPKRPIAARLRCNAARLTWQSAATDSENLTPLRLERGRAGNHFA